MFNYLNEKLTGGIVVKTVKDSLLHQTSQIKHNSLKSRTVNTSAFRAADVVYN
jgi:hypothetical protein